MPSQLTQDVLVEVDPQYQPLQSKPENSYYFWTYTVTLKNTGQSTVQLISRHWIITDSTGHVEEVKGEGVVGQQPILEPGESFVYTSACPLPTPRGTMRGSYHLVSEEGDSFEAKIPVFNLESDMVYH